MSLGRTVTIFAVLWLSAITSLHTALNLHLTDLPLFHTHSQKPFKVGFLPVTCHLSCPVTDFINKQISGHSEFGPIRFQSFPELKEAFLAGDTPATFILAPLAMKLREEGVPIKIVYLGHRDGSAMVVHRDSDIRHIEDLKGKTVAVPNRFSNRVSRPVKRFGWLLLPLLTLVDDRAPIFLIFLASVFPIMVSAIAAVQNIQPVYVRAARNFRRGTMGVPAKGK